MEYYSTIKKNEVMPFSATWMGLEINIPSKVNQKQKDKYHMISFICGIKNLKWASHWLSGKESTCSAGTTGEMGSIPGSGRSPEEGHGNPLQYSCLENPMDRGAWQAMVHRIAKSQT